MAMNEITIAAIYINFTKMTGLELLSSMTIALSVGFVKMNSTGDWANGSTDVCVGSSQIW